MSISTNDTPGQGHCACVDPDLDQLAALMGEGFTQREVSHLLWGDRARVSSELIRAQDPHDLLAWIRAEFTTAFPWLRLPTPTSEGVTT